VAAGAPRICDERGLLLVLDEIYTGFGRTGRWFACEHWGVVPDLLVVGKALTGGLPFAACIGTDEVMEAWPRSTGEAIHTSTFLGHPVGCAAALASISVLEEEGLVERSARLGAALLARLDAMLEGHPRVGEVRGLGMMIGVELVRDARGREPAPELVGRVVVGALREGVTLLGGGIHGNVLSLSPPFVLSELRHPPSGRLAPVPVGNRRVKVLPWPALLSTLSSPAEEPGELARDAEAQAGPPCATRRALLHLPEGLEDPSSSSDAIPIPVSETAIESSSPQTSTLSPTAPDP
jgi:hypothetical protein